MPTIKLSFEEFLHISNHKPGTCDCELCRNFWENVERWIADVSEHETERK